MATRSRELTQFFPTPAKTPYVCYPSAPERSSYYSGDPGNLSDSGLFYYEALNPTGSWLFDKQVIFMNPMLNIARQAALNAGKIIVRGMNRLQRLQIIKKGRNDYVTEVDRLAEQEIIGTIRHSYPEHAFLAEESGQSGESEFVWIIDPLDGTTNYLHGFPVFAVSIALQINGRLECGLIYDVLRQEIFEASRGQGAQVDGHRIRVSKQAGMKGSLIGTGFPFRNNNRWLDEYMEMLKAVIKSASGIRRPGAAALDLAYVAAGRLDGFWETGLSPWDMAAGAIIIKEAGGFVTDFSGDDNFLESGNIIAGTPKVYKELMKTIHPFVGALCK